MREALFFAARLRLPANTSAEDIAANVAHTAEILDLQDIMEAMIGEPDSQQ